MRPSPDVDRVRACLDGVARRLRARAAALGAAAGLAAGALAVAAGWTGSSTSRSAVIGLGLVAAAMALSLRRVPRSAGAIGAVLEAGAPARNLIRTSAELLDQPGGPTPAYVVSRVHRDALAAASAVDLTRVIPLRRAAVSLVAAIGVWLAALAAGPLLRFATAPDAVHAAATPVIDQIDIDITPPPYIGQTTLTLRDPSRVSALAGSRLTVRVRAAAAAVDLETIGARVTLEPGGDGLFTAEVSADADGFLAVTPRGADRAEGVRRLVGLSVAPDAAPRVRIVSPGRDLMLPAGDRTFTVTIEADDDHGLASVGLTYTRVTGSGENFTFTSGTVPVAVHRSNARAWAASAVWPLAPLALEPGDLVIYRAVATDHRPGAWPAESDAFVVEIAAPGAVPAEGFAVDDRFDKYAISQQMVIVKTERLLAARATMTSVDWQDQARDLAAEQRQVRAEFVFMMGGELADHGVNPDSLNEEEEAAGEDDLAAGRLANQGRADLMRAIRAMSRAATRLFDADLEAALPVEREALDYLQRAFSRSRYILRMLSERERLDLSRRLTGLIASLGHDARPAMRADPDPRLDALRKTLADVAALAGDPLRATPAGVARAMTIAQQVLALDPSAPAHRDAAEVLSALGDRASLPLPDVDRALDRTARLVAALIRAELPESAVPASASLDALSGALADALRRGPRR